MARFFLSKKTPAQSLRECSNDEKKSYLIQPDANVRKIYYMTKFSYKNLDFVKWTLQNAQNYI